MFLTRYYVLFQQNKHNALSINYNHYFVDGSHKGHLVID